MRILPVVAALSATLLAPSAPAATDDVAELRRELDETKALVQRLEERLAAMEARPAEPAAGTAAAAPVVAAASSANAFNPAISAVLQGSYNAYAHEPGEPVISGFALGDEAGPDSEGFSLGESEVNLSANVDPLFYGSLTAALKDDAGSTEVSLEEAFIETLGLPGGLKVKAGRMFPVLGYLNEIHAHADAFVDRPLPYRAMLGGDNFSDDGLQVSMLLPTGLYAEVGGGMYRGTGFPAAGSASDGRGAETLFGRLGGDIGESQSWIAGLSFLRAEAIDRQSGNLSFTGATDLYALDAKYTWAPGGNLASRSLVLQGEYLWRNEDGAYNDRPYDEDASGWYAQAVYKFAPRWKIGYRYARMRAPDVPTEQAGTALDNEGHEPWTQSLLLEFDNSEFSSLRVQLTRDASGPVPNDEAVLRYTTSMGAHGAHKY